MKTRRAHVWMPDDRLREIDAIAGSRGRSAFLVETAPEALKRRKLLAFLESDEVAWKDEDHPELANRRRMGPGTPARKRNSQEDKEETKPAHEMKLLLDTTVTVDVLRNRQRRRALLADLLRAGHRCRRRS
jgi:hypothetical protein